ncbi:MAG: hypothetical protein WBO97_01355 [Tepidiformaceae bacterium]
MQARFFRLSVLLIIATALGIATTGEASRAEGGIGVYPTRVSFEDALRGGEYFSTLGVINNLPSERRFAFEAEGEIASWITFTTVEDRSKMVTEVLAPKGKDGYVLLRLNVPDTTGNGVYGGTVTTRVPLGDPDVEKGTSGADVTVAAVIEVEVHVSGVQKIDGGLLEVTANDVEVGVPLRVRTTVANRSNIRVVPDVQVAIKSENKTVATVATVDAPISANETRAIETLWKTDVAPPGDYTLTVSASLPGFPLGDKTVSFRVLPRGTLTRDGVLENLELTNEPTAGGVAKVLATFRNTGQIESTAVFAGELYRDGVLIKPVTSLQKLVGKDEALGLEVLVEIPGTGSYVLRGKVNYEGKETGVREVAFTLAEAKPKDSSSSLMLGFAGGTAALVAAAAAGSGLFVVRRRRRPEQG